MPDDDAAPDKDRSILKDLVLNQYQAIVLAGVAAVSLLSASPLPLMIWLGGELVVLPTLDSGPVRRLLGRRRRVRAARAAETNRARALETLETPYARRYAAMQQLCAQIEFNYQALNGLSQAYLSEQRGKLDVILDGCLNRLVALQRYDGLLQRRSEASVQQQIRSLQRNLEQSDLPDRARAALEKNIELKRQLVASLSEARGTIVALDTELDSMTSLLEVLHQNSIAMRDPQAVSQELDAIAKQSEDSERVVREMEALVQANSTAWGDLPLVEPSRSVDESEGRKGRRRRERDR
jgi:hypothetical protein